MPRNEMSAAVIGRVLREARERAGATQQDVALTAGMDRAYLSEVENGKRSLSVDRLLRLCRAIGVKPSAVVDEVDAALQPKAASLVTSRRTKRPARGRPVE